MTSASCAVERGFVSHGSSTKTRRRGIRYKKTEGMSYYNASQLSFEQRSQFAASRDYTFSRNVDTSSIDQTQDGANDLPQNPVRVKAERGLSTMTCAITSVPMRLGLASLYK